MFRALLHTLREDVYSSEQSAHNSVIMTPLAGARTTFQYCLEKLRHARSRVQAGDLEEPPSGDTHGIECTQTCERASLRVRVRDRRSCILGNRLCCSSSKLKLVDSLVNFTG